jgi:hypothetical protein
VTELLFYHDGWTVVTSSWTVASKSASGIVLCYPWSGLNGFSLWGSDATGVARVEIAIPMQKFVEMTKHGGRVDLRKTGL